MKIIATSLGFFLFVLITQAQVQQVKRTEIEIESKHENYNLIPIGKEGIMVFNEGDRISRSDDRNWDFIQYDNDSKLNLLPSGPIPPNPAELVGSEQMATLMKKMQNHFTHVVVDSPPIASFTDGVLVASMVDGVILVVHSGKSSRQVVRRSRQLLQDVGVKVFGVVLNKVNLRAQDNYYYQSYYHRDYYRSGDEELFVR